MISLAQVPQTGNAAAESPNSGAPANLLASGTFLPVELSKPVDARRSKVNDRIEAKTLTDVLVQGQIVVPRNTKIIGHVTDARARSKTSPDSTVSIAFDRMILKNDEVLVAMTITRSRRHFIHRTPETSRTICRSPQCRVSCPEAGHWSREGQFPRLPQPRNIPTTSTRRLLLLTCRGQ